MVMSCDILAFIAGWFATAMCLYMGVAFGGDVVMSTPEGFVWLLTTALHVDTFCGTYSHAAVVVVVEC